MEQQEAEQKAEQIAMEREREGEDNETTGADKDKEEEDTTGDYDRGTVSDIEEVVVNLKFKDLEKLTDSEYSKLSVAHKKMARNIETVMDNLCTIKDAMVVYGTGFNRLVRNVTHNTELVDVIDNELGHFVGQVVDMQHVVSGLQNENKAIKEEFRKKDLERDEIDKEVRKRNLVISGLTEELNENLYVRTVNILKPICNAFQQEDIDCVYRVGTPTTGKTREVIVELFSKYVKESILKGRRNLKEYESTKNVWINEDLPHRLRKTKGVMRDIVRRAGEVGIPCALSGDKITCNNITYDMHHLKALPVGLRPDDLKTRTVGMRIGFMSQESYLSNFYPCPVTVDGYTFPSAKHAIQYKRSIVCGREDVGIDIKQKLDPADAKSLGETLKYNRKWDRAKIGLVRCIVRQKFLENNNLKIKLLNTTGYTLEESSFDRFWGTGVPVYSKDFTKGTHTGKNIMGRLLEEIRDDFLPKNRRRESGGQAVVDGQQSVPQATNDAAETNSKDGNLSTTSKYMEGMSEQVLKSMLLGLRNTNTGHDVQEQIITRLGQISAGDILRSPARAATTAAGTADKGAAAANQNHAPSASPK